jgi:DNA-directed RNA polymerase subunit RPC12/RpoP
MSFVRGRFGNEGVDPLDRARDGQVEERRATRDGHVCSGTLACPRCDAPVSAGDRGLTLTEELRCPFCAHRDPVREFLSLDPPTRPARVVVRVTLPRA